MAIDQRMLAEYLRKQQQQGMSLGRPPITMESQVNALANQPLAPGMVGAYVDQSKPDPRAKSFTGEENRIKSQRAMANMLRGKEAPKGKTVGPYDLYMGPNWGESLAYAGEQALGGYLAGKANRDDIALDEEKGRVLAATLAAQDEENARKAALEQAKLDHTIANDADQLAVSQGNLDVSERRLNTELGKRKTIAFWHPAEEGATLNLLRDDKGNYYSMDGEPVPGAYVDNLTLQTFGQGASKPLTPSQQADVDENEIGRGQDYINNDIMSNLLLDPEKMMAATGPFYDLKKQAVKYAAAPFGLEEEQATQMQLSNLSMEAVGPTLEKLGVNPTDKDLAVAMDGAPEPSKEPEAFYEWYKTRWTPALVLKTRIANPDDPQVAIDLQRAMEENYKKGHAEYEKVKNDPILKSLFNKRNRENGGWGDVRVSQ